MSTSRISFARAAAAAGAAVGPVLRQRPACQRLPAIVGRSVMDRPARRRTRITTQIRTAAAAIPRKGIVRTALCVEPRERPAARLHAAGAATTEDYLDLVAAVERRPRRSEMPVVIEGTPPPHDPRLEPLQGDARSGVIEVNLHPAHRLGRAGRSHDHAVRRSAAVTRLGTEKFMLDGRTPAPAAATTSSSAARRRRTARFCAGPICCAAWSATGTIIRRCRICSPACSSGRPVSIRASTKRGTTRSTSWRSPSRSIPDHGDCPPWLVDRMFRNLLVDVTGNTHRAEFCIDKLYSPDTSSRPAWAGRAARVRDAAARADEPDAAAAAARADRPFWKDAVRPAARALGHGAARSLHAAALRRAGFRRRARRPAARRAIRCSRSGSRRTSSSAFRRTARSRSAACTWNCGRRSSRGTCWARSQARGGTVRYVDSSVERLQVKVSGMTGRAACRDVQRPPRAAASDRTAGEFVAGVRYRAWQPPSCLHPTIPVHAPLVFDLVDTWNDRSLGGCVYHVAHPGGRQLRDVPGERLRSRKPPAGALLQHRPHAGPGARRRSKIAIPTFR